MRTLATLLCAAMAAVVGCSFSDSSASISDSISSPSDMISSSSSDDAADTAYRDDITDHTRTVVAAGGSAHDITGDLGAVAARHGITDWEAVDSTYVGIGRGLALAGVDSKSLAAYEDEVTAVPARTKLIRRGFDSATLH